MEGRGVLDYATLAARLLRLEQLPDERVDGHRYLRYWGYLEERDLADVIMTGLTGQVAVPAVPGAKGGPVETHLWLDPRNFLPHRVQMHGEWTMGEETSVQTFTFEFARYGEEVAVRDAPRGARPVVEELKPGRVLGIRCSTATAFLRDRYGLPEGRGCVVLRVGSPSAAERAGFEIGDKIIRMDGMPITSGRQFTFLIQDLPSRGHRTFVVQRGDQELTLEVELADHSGAPKDDPYFYYLRARGLAADSADHDADIDQILADYSRQTEEDPGFELPYVYRGELQIGRNDKAALAELEKALGLDPKLTEAYRALAELAHSNADFDAAIRHIDRAIELNGCPEAVPPWDIDCAEDIATRAFLHLGRLKQGDDALVERDLDAIEGVMFFGPIQLWNRILLAFARGDDATVAALTEEFVQSRLTLVSSHLWQTQKELQGGSLSNEAGYFVMPEWIVGHLERVSQGQEYASVIGSTSSAGKVGLSIDYSFELPEAVFRMRLDGELWQGAYRVASFRLDDEWGKHFRVFFRTAGRSSDDGPFELRIFVDGELVRTLVAEEPAWPPEDDSGLDLDSLE